MSTKSFSNRARFAAPRRAARNPVRAWLATILSTVLLASLAFTGMTAPWATGLEPGDQQNPAETLIAAVEDSETTLTSGGDDVPPAQDVTEDPPAVDPPAEDPPAEDPPADDPPAEKPEALPSVQELKTEEAPLQDELGDGDGIIQPFATSTSSDIVVTARTTAQPLGFNGGTGTNHALTNGGTYQVYLGNDNPTTAVAGASCTITTGGSCTINLEGTNVGGAHYNQQRWIVQTAPATGTYMNPELRLGDAFGPTTVFRYVGRTPALQSNQTYQMPGTVGGDTSTTRSFGAVPNSITNPLLVPSCQAGIKVALVMDLSGSVSTEQRTQFRNAIIGNNGLFDALMGTNSSISVFTFGTNSPAGTTTNHPVPMVLNTTNRSTLEGRIQTNTGQGTQYTNWDRALREVANHNATNDYDMVLFITDGAPNYIAQTNGGSTAIDGSTVTTRSLEAAIYSANAIKTKGTRVLGVGVGAGVSGDVGITNLRAVSGDTLNTDYFQTTNWSVLNRQLADIANAATCQVPITITKYVQNINGSNPTRDNGWTVNAVPSSVSPGSSTLTPLGTSQVTSGTAPNPVGQASWILRFTEPNATGTVTVSENAASKPGHAFVSGSCTIDHAVGPDTVITLTGPGPQALTGIKPTDIINCTYTNKPIPTSLTVEKEWTVNGQPMTAAVLLSTYGATATPTANPVPSGNGTPAFGTPITGYTPGTVVRVGENVSYGAQCVVDKASQYRIGDGGLLPLGSGADITLVSGSNEVTIVNSLICGATLTLIKNVVNNNGGTATADAWALSATGPSNVGGPGAASPGTTYNVIPGTYTLNETGGPAGYNWTGLVCDNPNSTTGLGNKTVPVTAGGHVTCTYTNDDQPGQLTLIKNVINNNGGTATADAWALSASGPSNAGGPGAASPGTTYPVNAGTYTLIETGGPAGYTWTNLVCSNGNTSLNDKTVTVAVGQNVTCTFTNDDQPGQLTLIKNVVNDDGGTATAGAWALSASGPSNVGGPGAASPGTTYPVNAGTYTLNETGGPAGYTWTNLLCDNPNSTTSMDNKTVAVGLGQHVTCTFTNDDNKPKLQLVKQVSGASQDLAIHWTLTGTGTGVALTGAGGVPMTEVPGGVGILLNETRGDFPGAGEFANGTSWVCVDTANDNAPVSSTANTVNLASGQAVTCTIINTHNPVTPTITKEAVSTTHQANGTWTTVYTVTVTNPSSVQPVTYDVEDTLLFGGGVTVDSASATGPGALGTWNGTSNTLMVDDQVLAAGAEPAVYTVTVNATINVGALGSANAQLTCSADPATRTAGGFLNAVDLRVGNNIVGSDEDCLQPAFPSVAKSVGTPAQQANGTWTVVYTVTATNASTHNLYYTLSDTLAFDPDLGINSAGATGPGGTSIPTWTGVAPNTSLTANPVLLPPGSHAYTITVNLTVPTTATSADVTCGVEGQQGGTGTFNSATMTSSGQNQSDDACVDIPLPGVDLDKTVTGVRQLANGRWEITYEIDVTNTHQTLATRYTLNDTLTFGGGLTPLLASWNYQGIPPAGSSWTLPGNLTANLATNMLIGAGITHTYEVVVEASVAANVIGTTASQCSGDDGTAGGGFLNVANVTFPGGTDRAADCAEPALPNVSKTFVSSVQNDDGTWTVSYTIGVRNTTTDLDMHYNLSDQPGFPAGVTVNNWTVTAAAETPAVDPAINGPYVAPGTIATARPIEAGATHTYTVVFNLAIPAGLPDGAEECSPNRVPGTGLFNQATLTSGNDTVRDDDCAPIEEVGTPTVTKTATGVSQNADGTWSVTYDLTVTSNPDFVTTYNLTDTLRFGAGASVNSAAWSWSNAPTGTAAADLAGAWTNPVDDNLTATIATNRVLAKGDGITHTYSVTVNATVPQASIGGSAMDCVLGTDEDGTGFLNEATLTSGSLSSTVTACEQPTKPSLEKTGAAVAQQTNGAWNVTYAITVDNTDGVATVYDLADEPAFASGVTISNWSVVAGSGTPAVAPAISAAEYTDGVIATDRALPAGTTHTYQVTFSVTIAANIASADMQCLNESGGAGQGLFNEALLAIADGTDRDDDCIGIPEIGKPTVAKALGTVTQGVDGRWTITYTVTVTGHATQVTRYTLHDTIAFGGAATVQSADWVWNDHDGTVPPAASGSWPASDPTVTLAADQLLQAGATDSFTVTVVADVATGAIGSAGMTCSVTQDGPAAAGFLNTVDLYVGNVLVDEDFDCGEPAAPTFTKTAVGLTDNADGTWDAVYTLAVTSGATDGQSISYNLTDTPVLPGAVTLVDATVANTAPGSIATNAGWGASDSSVVSGVALPAGATHVYTVTLTVEFTGLMTPAERDCELVEGEEASGLLNTGAVTSGTDGYPSQDCLPIPDPEFTVAKDVASAIQLADGTWRVVYTVTVENTSSIPGAYLLTDTLDYGAGLTPTAASWTLASPAASGSWDLAVGDSAVLANNDRGLAAGGQHVYTVTVVATVAAGTALPTTAFCSGEDGLAGGGFLNTVDLTFPGGSDDDAACDDPTVPEIFKTAQTLAQNTDASWTVTYDLVVDNRDGKASFYSLADVPVFAGDVTIVNWTVTPQAGTPALSTPINGSVWTTPGTIAADVAIASGATHTYEVAFKVTIPAGIPAADRECDVETGEGNGLFNGAELISGEQTRNDDDCLDIPEIGIPSVTKQVASVVQQLDGSWLITYDVVVTANATHHSVYDLSDTISFGGDATVTAAAWTAAGASPSAGAWTDPVDENLTTTLATGRLIAAGTGTHVYTVAVTAELPQAAIDTPAMDCQLGEGEEGTGFLNAVTLSSGALTDTDQDCATPTEPTIAKHGAAVAQQPDASWNVTYDLTVDNTGGHPTFYDLTDIQAFASGVTVNSWNVVATGLTMNLNPPVDGPYSDGVIVEGRRIGAGVIHTYRVTFNVDIAVSISDEVRECAVEGEPEGAGFFNTALLGVGDGTLTDDDCIEIPEPGIPTVAKTLGTVVQGADGIWTVTYQVVVTGDDVYLTRYDLVDDLLFPDGAEIVGASWTWDDAPEGATDVSGTWADPMAERSATLATGRVLGVDETDTYTVTVRADVAADAVGTPEMLCAEQGTETASGFFNLVQLWVGEDVVDEDQACGEPAAPSFTKTGLDLTANGDGTFDAVYELRVTSNATNGQVINYDLADMPDLPAEVELVSRSVSSGDVTVDPGWDDETTDVIVAGESIGQDEEHVFTVTLTIRVTAPMTPDMRDCELTEGEETTGLVNTGLVTSGNDGYTDEGCLELPDPTFDVVKTADSAVETEVGIWDVTYTVTVRNTSDVPGTYSVTDTLRYGPGITPTAGTWSRGDVTGVFDLAAGEAVLATDEPLEAGGAHVFTVVITATVAPGIAGSDAGACEPGEGGTGSGFLNTAQLNWDEEPTEDDGGCIVIDQNYGAFEVSKVLAGASGGYTAGFQKAFTMQWSCEAPDGSTLDGVALVAATETVTLHDQVPVGSVCSVTEVAPSGNLAPLHRWLAPRYSASEVTLTIADPVGQITVTNEIVKDLAPRPTLPSSGLDDGQQGLLGIVGLLAALGLVAGAAVRRRQES